MLNNNSRENLRVVKLSYASNFEEFSTRANLKYVFVRSI